MARLETGVAQEGDDWPGVFIRGDNAIAFAMSLRVVLDGFDDTSMAGSICKSHCEGLIKLLHSADVRSDPKPQRVTLTPTVTR